MITATQVSKQYGHTTAVDDISFEVKEGENLVLLGTSGCGKTTTLKMLNRLILASSGCITINGTDITQQQAETLRRSIGYVLQQNSLFPHYTVAENIAVVPSLLQWDKKKIAARTDELLDKLQLSPAKYLSAYPNQLSGGQQQRVNIARALAADPPILLMDEPFGALDTITRTSITKDFSEIDEFMRKTIVMVTHDVKEAFLIGDNICIMNAGKIVQQGKPLELLFAPANDFVKEFLSGSYLQLALSSIKASDIWDTLQNTDSKTIDAPLSESSTLWDMMEYALKHKNSTNVYLKNGNGITKQIDKNSILKYSLDYNYNGQ